MNTKKIYLTFLILSPILIVIGALWKILHWPPNANLILSVGFILSLIYLIIGIITIIKSVQMKFENKILWVISFCIFTWITGVIYYLKVLKKMN